MEAKCEPHGAQTPAVPAKDLPGSLPTIPVPEDVDHAELARTYLDRLHDLTLQDLGDEPWFKDVFALTDTFRTLRGAERVLPAWRELVESHAITRFDLVSNGSRVVQAGQTSWINASFSFQCATKPARTGSGSLRIIPDASGGWKIWIISTLLEQIPDFGNVDVLAPKELSSRAINGKDVHSNGDTKRHFDCMIAGAGMAGLSMCGRLQALGVSYLALETNAEIGGNWTNRYDSVLLHTSRESGQMPFERTWGPEYPYFLSGKHLAEGFQKHVNTYGLNVQLSSRVEKATWDQENQMWTVMIRSRHGLETVTARHLVLAIGAAGSIPKKPNLPGEESFQGEILHSVRYKTAIPWKGKKGVIIGTANTAHDVAEDMLDAGLESVTMVQRNATPLLPISYYRAVIDPIYNENIPTELSDRVWLSGSPAAVTRLLTLQHLTHLSSQDSEYFDALDRVGFRNERVCDLSSTLYERLGGHYLDVGASAKVAKGLIKIKSDAALAGLDKNGLLFNDGSTLDADVLVFATGFEGNMRMMAKELLDSSVLDKMDDFFHFDAEGELRGAWKPMEQQNIWYTGGGIGQARFFSRFVALQIKADLEGATFSPYLKYKP